jgi:high affinity sulfate transporter 1
MRALFPAGLPLRASLPKDVVAGLTAAAVVIPKAIAYAAIAGVQIQVGLYTAVIPMVVYAFLGTSRPLSVSTTTTIAILTGAELATVAPEQVPAATAMLALLTGGFLAVAGLLRLGFVAKFISEPVLVGFKAGIGLVIVVDQLPKFLGVHIDKGGWFHNLVQSVTHIPDASGPALLIALIAIVLIFVLERFVPKSPAPLIALAVAIGISWLTGAEAKGVSTIGAIPGGLPTFHLPDWSLARELWPAALGITLMSFTETIAAARAFVNRDEPRPSPNRELLATGAGNVACGFFGAMPSGGGTSQTAVNRASGARTQMAGLVTAAMGLATLLFLAPVIAVMPNPGLAAVVIATSLPLISVKSLHRIRKFRVLEFAWSLAAMAGVVFLGTLNGILAAVVLSMATLAHQANNPTVYVMVRKPGTDHFRPVSKDHPEDESFPGLLILRTDGRVHFGNVDHIGEQMADAIRGCSPKVLLLDCSGIAGFEYTALERLDRAEEQLCGEGVELWLAGLSPEAFELAWRSELGQRLGRPRMHFTVAGAVETFQAKGPCASRAAVAT